MLYISANRNDKHGLETIIFNEFVCTEFDTMEPCTIKKTQDSISLERLCEGENNAGLGIKVS